VEDQFRVIRFLARLPGDFLEAEADAREATVDRRDEQVLLRAEQLE
jgi:hypothetical protein